VLWNTNGWIERRRKGRRMKKSVEGIRTKHVTTNHPYEVSSE
jgi:hypothetical protein